MVSASLGHDISNSLALIQFAVDELVEAAAAGQVPPAETMRLLVTGRDRLVAQTHSALRLSGRGARTPVRHDLGLVIAELVDVMRGAGLVRRVAVDVCVDAGDLEVVAHRAELEQLVLGIVVAAVDRDAARKRVAIPVSRSGDRVRLEVDRGIESAGRVPGRHLVVALGGSFAIEGTSIVVELPAAHSLPHTDEVGSGVRETVREAAKSA